MVAITITHINKCSLGSFILFKNEKEFWDPEAENCWFLLSIHPLEVNEERRYYIICISVTEYYSEEGVSIQIGKMILSQVNFLNWQKWVMAVRCVLSLFQSVGIPWEWWWKSSVNNFQWMDCLVPNCKFW